MEDLCKIYIEDGDRENAKESTRLGIGAENLAVKDLAMEDQDRVDIENKGRKDIEKVIRPGIVADDSGVKDVAVAVKQSLIRQTATVFIFLFFQSVFFLFFYSFKLDTCGCFEGFFSLTSVVTSVKQENLSSKYANVKM